ncbi:MAG: radical SAM protein [Planctomycetaceae bacterium]|nr:radical SAM protein [Planctomycetaceae bacterium]
MSLLPILSTEFHLTQTRKGQEIFHSFSRGLCPVCRELVDGARIIRDGKVYLRRQCPKHGMQESLISGDVEWFLKSLSFARPGIQPKEYSTNVEKGCPHDCGLCPDHEQHSCLPIIEITNHCDLECPICIVQNRHNYHMTRTEFVSILDGLVRKEELIDTVNLSGGEPMLHPEILQFIDTARQYRQFTRLSISTNGLRIASDWEFCQQLAERGVYINLQLDSLSNQSLRTLRGTGRHDTVKQKALENLERAGVRTTIVATIARGVNDHEIGDCVRLVMEKDFILSLMFQPAAYTGTGGSQFGPHDPLDIITIPDIVRCMEEQTGGDLKRSDFLPLPCSHPGCFALTYLLKTEDGCIPFPRFIELENYIAAITNRGTIRPDDRFDEMLRNTIDQLWSAAGQIPDSPRILRTLKRALRLMFPDDRRIELEERLRLGEGLVKTIFIHAFMDEHTFEVDRIRKCCTHYALPDGRLMPGCAYNMMYRHRDSRFTGPIGTAQLRIPGQ